MPRFARTLAAFGLIVGMAAFAAEPDGTDWSKYAKGKEVTFEIKKASGDEVILKVPSATMKNKFEDLHYTFAEGGLTRWAKIGPKFNGLTGKKVPLTAKELEPFKLPKTAPGYAGDKTDLKPGDFVTLVLVRPKDIPAAKVKESDLKIKYAIIQRVLEDPVVKEPEPKKDEKKKDEKKAEEKK
jgi:hypothetical protein